MANPVVKPQLFEKLVAWEDQNIMSRMVGKMTPLTNAAIPMGTTVFAPATVMPTGDLAWEVVNGALPADDGYVGFLYFDVPAGTTPVEVTVLGGNCLIKPSGVVWGVATDAQKAAFAYAACKQGIKFIRPEVDNFADAFTND